MCGIFGYSGKEGNKSFSLDKFTTLGVFNDARGKDSCGAFIDGEYDWGIDKNKLFADFSHTSSLLADFDGKPVSIAFGHCRKASVGEITIKEAQPVVISNDDESKVDFVMIHNGTLLNHSELASKYLSSYPEWFTDSQIFAHIVYYHGFKVLKEYDGAGAFAFVDYRGPKVKTYLFKGASPNYKGGVNNTEERPLYMCEYEDGIYWSSLKTPLEIITFGTRKITDIAVNNLIEIEDGKIVSQTLYDRSNRFQMYSNNTYCYNEYYNYYEGYYEKGKSKKSEKGKSKVEGTSVTMSLSEFNDEKIPSKNYVRFCNGRYYTGDELANGEHILTRDGFIASASSSFNKKFYFFEGLIMQSYFHMELAKKMKDVFGDAFNEQLLISIVYQPFYSLKTKRLYTVLNGWAVRYSGSFPVMFSSSNKKYTIVKGEIKSCNYNTSLIRCDAFEEYKELSRNSREFTCLSNEEKEKALESEAEAILKMMNKNGIN